MAANRWIIISGLVVLIAMLVLASFALGVYVGEHGWTREALRYQPGTGPRQAGPQAPIIPNGRQPGPNAPLPGSGNPSPPATLQPGNALQFDLPPGPPQIMGRVRRITFQSLELATKDGLRQVMLSPQTRIFNDTGAPIQWMEILVGDFVGIYGQPLQDGGKQFLADFVVKLPKKQ